MNGYTGHQDEGKVNTRLKIITQILIIYGKMLEDGGTVMKDKKQ